MSDDDVDALARSLDRPEAFEVIFGRYHRMIWAYVARLGGREGAEELAGDVFVAAFARRGTYDPQLGSVRSWLYGIASNLVRTQLRREGRAARAFERAGAQRIDDHDPVEDAFADLARREQLRAVLAALVRLARDDREIIALYAWERLSYGEIATALDIDIGTVRSRLFRARQRLRDLLAASSEAGDASQAAHQGNLRGSP